MGFTVTRSEEIDITDDDDVLPIVADVFNALEGLTPSEAKAVLEAAIEKIDHNAIVKWIPEDEQT